MPKPGETTHEYQKRTLARHTKRKRIKGGYTKKYNSMINVKKVFSQALWMFGFEVRNSKDKPKSSLWNKLYRWFKTCDFDNMKDKDLWIYAICPSDGQGKCYIGQTTCSDKQEGNRKDEWKNTSKTLSV